MYEGITCVHVTHTLFMHLHFGGGLVLFVCLFYFWGEEERCNLDTFSSQLGDLYEQFKIISFSVSSFLWQP